MSKPATALHTVTEHSAPARVRLIDRRDAHADPDDERRALVAGLFAAPAVISPKYFYDDIGCTLFEAICSLPEYYPTRTERAILTTHRDSIVQAVGTGRQFVDLGAGDCAKAALLLPALHARRYVAVDIAAAAIEPALSRLTPVFPRVEVMGVVTDFSRRFDLGGAIDAGPVTFFGITAAFNLNVLNHVNVLADCDFTPAGFAHVAFYDPVEGRVEMHLESRHLQRVRVGRRERVFVEGERIHTENSYKYHPGEFADLLASAAFTELRVWQDGAGDFAVFYAS